MDTSRNELERLVREYAPKGKEGLFKLELEKLVLIAQREGFQDGMREARRILGND